MGLHGKVAIVTGGNSGIGKAVVLALAEAGASVGTQIAARQMIAQGADGRIINMSSVHEDWPMPGNTPYCLSKGGMRMLTRTAGVELGPPGGCRWSASGRAPWRRRSTSPRWRIPRR